MSLSKARLGRMHDVMAGYVERGDTIFRIASLTKPIAAAATMILVEECRLRLDEPVDRLLPELAHRTVLKRLEGPLGDTVPANRPITVRDLLTFRAGYGIVMAPPDTHPIQRAMSEQRLGQGPPKPQTPPAPDEWIRRLGTLPLMHQPGEKWMYHTASDILDVLIARASGRPLETFLRERVFEPLGTKDTGSACRRPRSTGWRRAMRSIRTPARSRSMTRRRAVSGAARRHSHRPAGGSSPPSTTTWRSARCC
jgi:CubicO group peptidase (beta-lactamase class C family)